MSAEIFSYIIALGALGTASGLAIVGNRTGDSLTYTPHKIAASLSGLADILLMIIALFRFPFGQAIIVIVAGSIITAILSTALPAMIRPALVLLFALIGAIAAFVHFV